MPAEQNTPLTNAQKSIRHPTSNNVSSENSDVALSRYNMALIADKEKRPDAELMFKEALHCCETDSNTEHANLATIATGLAAFYMRQARYAEAEPLLQRALAIRETINGIDHLDVAVITLKLANVYLNQGKHAEAETLFRRTLEIREKALGTDHPNLAAAIIGLAILRYNHWEWTESETLYRRALAIKEKTLGADHLDVAAITSQVAHIYSLQWKHTEAVTLSRRALEIREKALGADHANVALALISLAHILVVKLQIPHKTPAESDMTEVETLYKRALAIQEHALGTENLAVASTLLEVGEYYSKVWKCEKAETCFKRALAIRQKTLGPKHLDAGARPNESVLCMYNIGTILNKQATQGRSDSLGSFCDDSMSVKLVDPVTGDRIYPTFKIDAKEEEANLWFRKAAEAAHVKSLNNESELSTYTQSFYKRSPP